MTIFVVFRVNAPERVGPAIRAAFPSNFIQLQDDEWLISADLTPEEVCERIGVGRENSGNGSAMVFSMRSYFGRAPTNIWDWIKTKAEGSVFD